MRWRRHGFATAVLLVVSSAHAGTAPPRLAGTVVAGNKRIAILSSDGVQTDVEEGDRFGRFVVARVRPGQVELDGPDGRVLLGTQPEDQPQTAPTPAPPPSTVATPPRDQLSDK